MSRSCCAIAHGSVKHGSVKTHLLGFILSIILTIISFAAAMSSPTSHAITLTVIISSGLIQVLVHIICFLHMNISSKEHWNLTALLFTITVICIILIGSLWIMYNLNNNMMMS